MDIEHIIPDDGFAHIIDEFELLGCPCDADVCEDDEGRAILHHRMDGKPDEIWVVEDYKQSR